MIVYTYTWHQQWLYTKPLDLLAFLIYPTNDMRYTTEETEKHA
jgi:hypothetical protein